MRQNLYFAVSKNAGEPGKQQNLYFVVKTLHSKIQYQEAIAGFHDFSRYFTKFYA